VIAEGTNAGEKLQASLLLLPPATTIVTPALVAESIAVWNDRVTPGPPKLMLPTRGPLLLATQSMPDTIPDVEPEPWSLRTLTLLIEAPGATP